MTDETRPELPEVLAPAPGLPAVGSGIPRGAEFPPGSREVPAPRNDEADAETASGVDGDQDPKEAMNAWFRGAEGLIMAYWHDPRTAIKYAVGILQLLQKGLTEEEILAIDPTSVPPITEIEAGWR